VDLFLPLLPIQVMRQQFTGLTPVSQLITQFNRASLLNPLLGVSTSPHIAVTLPTETTECAQLYGDIWRIVYKFSARVNQVAVIFVAATLIAALVQQYGPKALIWIRKNMSKFLYQVAYRIQLKESLKLDSPLIDITI
jgi:hypothetical protein